MSGSAIYNHRTLQPTGSAHGHTRLGDALEVVKHEYELVAAELVQARTLRDEYEGKVTSQINELNIIRQALYELEAQHGKVRQRYEDEIAHLRAELHALRQLPVVQGIQQHTSGPGVHPPDGYRNGIGERYPERDRERERERERERGGERDPKRLKMKGPDDLEERAYPAFLDMDPASVPAEMKKEGGDWFAIFNPRVRPRVLGDVGLVHTLVHATVVCCVQFSADGRYLATGCNRTAQIYDVKTGAKTCVLVDESAGNSGDLYIRSVRFSPDGRFLATGAEDKQVRIWDIAKKRIRSVFPGHTQEIYSLDFSRDGRRYRLRFGRPHCSAYGTWSPARAISPDGRHVAAGSLDTIVRIWDAQTGALVERLRGHRDSVYSVVFTPDGLGVVSGSLDKTLKYWDKEAGVVVKDTVGEKCTMNFKGHKVILGTRTTCCQVAVSHDGQWIVSGSKDRGVQFWDRAGVVHSMLQGHKNSVISIDLNPTGNLLATGSGDNLARIWSYATA
ncbi:chromatin associated protein [Mycena alexandri]|uniref:Chromatin associated protein n=1 Tax=Mycena alexandri TaxID=1745969 RepID=A0AAD6RXH6_9AGAR|nr:chromatin associated protein [Mycena alexandri]